MSVKRKSSRSKLRDAVICVDYTNVFGVISQRSDNEQPDAVVLDLIKELKRHLTDHLKFRPVRVLAFASLPPSHVKGHRATGAWLSLGIEPRFIYAKSTDEACAIELAMETMDLARGTGEETAFVLLSGNQWYVPLVQRLQRNGNFVIMATLESPRDADHLPEDCRAACLNAEFLLGGPGRKLSFENLSESDEDLDLPSKKPEAVVAITDDVVRRTLEIIDSYFGQYEEIYLTPLLRKLSEIFQDSEDEPKTLINDLEEAGAVWLEKRRGFPHNYTVLMMNEEHPDVAELKEARLASTDDSYDDEFYDDYPDEDEDEDAEEFHDEDDASYQE